MNGPGTARRTSQLLTASERRAAVALLVLMTISAGLETLGVGLVVPASMRANARTRDSNGRLSNFEGRAANAAAVDAGTERVLSDQLRYSDFISTLVPFTAPRWSHADLQRPWPRIGYELQRFVGWEAVVN